MKDFLESPLHKFWTDALGHGRRCFWKIKPSIPIICNINSLLILSVHHPGKRLSELTKWSTKGISMWSFMKFSQPVFFLRKFKHVSLENFMWIKTGCRAWHQKEWKSFPLWPHKCIAYIRAWRTTHTLQRLIVNITRNHKWENLQIQRLISSNPCPGSLRSKRFRTV